MGCMEVQVGVDVYCFQFFYQCVVVDVVCGFIDVDDKQMSGVLVISGWDVQWFKWCVCQFVQVVLGNFGLVLIGVVQFFQLDQCQSGIDIGKVVFEVWGDYFCLWCVVVGLVIISVYVQIMEFQVMDVGGQFVVIGDNQFVFGVGYVFDCVE